MSILLLQEKKKQTAVCVCNLTVTNEMTSVHCISRFNAGKKINRINRDHMVQMGIQPGCLNGLGPSSACRGLVFKVIHSYQQAVP